MAPVLVVLGAADGAVPTYERARELGYRTVAVDRDPDAQGVRYADEFLGVSTREPARIAAALAGRDDIRGVLAPASDAALPALAWLTRHWRLPATVSDGIVQASVDKAAFRAVCDDLCLPRVASVTGPPGPGLVHAAGALHLPVVVKPVDATGSRGVERCTTAAAVPGAVDRAAAQSLAGRVIVEEEVTGTHVSVEAVVDGGRPVFWAVSERAITPPPHFITTAQWLPARLPRAAPERLGHQLSALCARLGYRRGPLNVDAVVTPSGEVFPIELGARIGGNGLAELVMASEGVDLVAASIACAVGEPVELRPAPARPALLEILREDREGWLAAMDGGDEARALPHVVAVRLFGRVGAPVAPYVQAANKLGYVVVAGAPLPRLRQSVAAVRLALRWEVQDQPVVVAGP